MRADFLKSIIIHGIILILVVSGSYMQNRKVFLDLKLLNNPANNSANNLSNNTIPIKASLIDQQEVQQAVKRQEKVFAEKIARERKLEQQEQRIAKLAAISEQEAQKTQKEKADLKKDRDLLKKEQENLHKTISKLKQQQQDLVSEQAKLAKLKQQNSQDVKKKILSNSNIAQTDVLQTGGSQTGISQAEISQTDLQNYHNKMYTKIIGNRKVTSFFPEHLECTVKVKLLPDGQLHLVKLDQSSGNAAYDAFSEQAIYKSAPFEMPSDHKLNKELVELDHIFIFTANLVNTNLVNNN